MKSSGYGTIGAALFLVAAVALQPGSAAAQNFGSSGTSWSGSWGFASSGERSVNLQTAQAVRAARNNGPQTVVNNINDSRSNYVDYTAAAGSSFVSDFHVGNASTNTIGAMNTGETTITVEGEHNVITATNAADSIGCQDGSIASSTLGGQMPLRPFAPGDGGSQMTFNAARSAMGC